MRFLWSDFIMHLAVSAVCSLWICGCFFDADIPLRNDPPKCSDRSSINTSLVFPQSSVCTLSIDDLNDRVLDIWTSPCTTDSFKTASCDSSGRQPWPGGAEFIEQGYGTKKIRFTLDTNRMGRYFGMLVLQDAASATVAIPYTVEKLFLDPFDVFPPQKEWWRRYSEKDSLHFRYYYVDKKLEFSFVKNDRSPDATATTGMRTFFFLEDAFYTTVNFNLRDEMDDAFEVGFFISSSPDTGRWDGEKAGIFISGVNGRLRFECRSVNLQSYSYESGITAGMLGLQRTGSSISYFFHDGNPALVSKPLTSQMFPPNVPVYVHLKMSVNNLARTRNCYWNDFRIIEGLITFPSEQ